MDIQIIFTTVFQADVHPMYMYMYVFFVAPPSYPTNVRVITGSNVSDISWKRPDFVVTFFGEWITCRGHYYTAGALQISCRGHYYTAQVFDSLSAKMQTACTSTINVGGRWLLECHCNISCMNKERSFGRVDEVSNVYDYSTRK